MIRNLIAISILTLLLLLTIVPAVSAQEGGLTLKLRKDFGYAWAGEIQGTFSLRVSGPENLSRIEFLIDEEVIGEDTQSPFQFQFNTSNYALGTHRLIAVGYTDDGRTLYSNQINLNFVTSEVGWSSTGRFLIPILVVVFGVMLLSFIVPWLMNRGKPKVTVPLGAPRNYGVAGGTICPNCKRPFSRNLLSPNLLVGKLERCPHCGKWSLARRASAAELTAAEAAELEMTPEREKTPALSEQERLQRDLEESRYEDL